MRVTSAKGYEENKVGKTERITWTFRPVCKKGACSVRFRFGMNGATSLDFDFKYIRFRLARSGAVYRGSGTAAMSTCFYSEVKGPIHVFLRVVKAAWVGGEWRATRVRGSFRYSSPATKSGIVSCESSGTTETVKASLIAGT
jgi:hypothetical protein